MVSCFKPQKSPQGFITLASLIDRALFSKSPQSTAGVFKKAGKRASGVKFMLIGDGILRKQIEGLISEFNLDKCVILTGWRRDIPRILSAMDIFVLTSLWEGLPISVLEAMAACLPVVATDTGGISEVVIEGKTGFLVPRGDIAKMAERLVNLLEKEDLRRQFGLRARSSLGHAFSLENSLSRTEDLYQELIKQRFYDSQTVKQD